MYFSSADYRQILCSFDLCFADFLVDQVSEGELAAFISYATAFPMFSLP